jgi:dephospho-CoA kinase
MQSDNSDTIKIVGIAGLPRTGKDSLAELFIEKNFYGLSIGDIVRSFAVIRHKGEIDPISVANMTETANWLRETKGPDFALQHALDEYRKAISSGKKYEGLVLWSIRAPVEADFIVDHGGKIIWIEADDETRYQRYIEHLRTGEAKISLEELKAEEALQWKPQPGIPAEVQMNISYVQAKATIVLKNNNNDLDTFKKTAIEVVEQIIKN